MTESGTDALDHPHLSLDQMDEADSQWVNDRQTMLQYMIEDGLEGWVELATI